MLTYAIILLMLGIFFAVLEAFLPSGGVLGFLATAGFVVSIVLAFRQGENTGMLFLAIVLVTVPVVIIVGLKMFPHTPIGKRMILARAAQPTEPSAAGVSTLDFSPLLGKSGKTVTSLRPSGTIVIDGTRYSAVSRGKMLDNNMEITVVRIDGNSIVVDNISNQS